MEIEQRGGIGEDEVRAGRLSAAFRLAVRSAGASVWDDRASGSAPRTPSATAGDCFASCDMDTQRAARALRPQHTAAFERTAVAAFDRVMEASGMRRALADLDRWHDRVLLSDSPLDAASNSLVAEAGGGLLDVDRRQLRQDIAALEADIERVRARVEDCAGERAALQSDLHDCLDAMAHAHALRDVWARSDARAWLEEYERALAAVGRVSAAPADPATMAASSTTTTQAEGDAAPAARRAGRRQSQTQTHAQTQTHT